MKDYLIFAIYLYLVKHKQCTAKNIADEFDISVRSVYRYIDALSLLGMPIITKIGKGGGIEIIGNSYLENFMLSIEERSILFDFIQRVDIPEKVVSIIKKII